MAPNGGVAADVPPSRLKSVKGLLKLQAAPLGFASFDQEVVARAQALVMDCIGRFLQDDDRRAMYTDALTSS